MTGTTHIMVDLETLGTDPDSPIISIGATDGTYEFYGKIRISAAIGTISPATIEWWLKQDKAAIESTFFGDDENVYDSLEDLLEAFAHWGLDITHKIRQSDNYLIYGNGADFDLVMLKQSYNKCGLELPWNFRKQMCYRTLKNQFPEVVAPATEGVKHTSLADAKWQHMHLMRILNHINNMEAFYNNYDPE